MISISKNDEWSLIFKENVVRLYSIWKISNIEESKWEKLSWNRIDKDRKLEYTNRIVRKS